MKTRFLTGFLAAIPVSVVFSPFFYEAVLKLVPGLWWWLLGVPVLGYWLGQAPRNSFYSGVLCGWIAPVAIVLPDLNFIAWRLGSYGGCGNSLHWAELEATALLFCIPAALGQLRWALRKPKTRLPK